MPAVKPVVTGCGIICSKRPSRAMPMRTRIAPAIRVATSRPATPNCLRIGATSTTIAAVGPVIWTREPPSSAQIAPARIAVYRPYCGGTPVATAIAMARGNATAPTRMPAFRSARKSRAS